MKKSLLALAVAAALPAFAQAQTNVSLYGSLDMSLESVNGDANGGNSDLKVTDGVWSQSRLGFKGSEDLGGGLKGIFQMEHRFRPDTGAQTSGTSFWQGQSWVGLGGGFGEIKLGRMYTPVFQALLPGDMTGYSWYNNQVGLGGTRVRFGNEIEYKSPSLGGFTIYGAYSASGGLAQAANAGTGSPAVSDTSQEPAGTSSDATKIGDAIGVAGVGAFGPVKFGIGYHSIKDGFVGATGTRKELGASVGGKIGPVGIGLTYATVDPSGNNDKTKAFGATASMGFGAGTVYVSFTKTNPDGDNNNSTGLGLTYSHGLSKRTFAYASLDMNTVEQGAGQDDLKPRAIALGVRHFF
ncbi:MAG: porin [Lautropia sp.]